MSSIANVVPLFLAVIVLLVALYTLQGGIPKEGFHPHEQDKSATAAAPQQAKTQEKPKGFSISDNTARFSSLFGDEIVGGSAKFASVDFGNGSMGNVNAKQLTVETGLKVGGTSTFGDVTSNKLTTKSIDTLYTASGEVIAKNKLCLGDKCFDDTIMSNLLRTKGVGPVGPQGPQGQTGERGPAGAPGKDGSIGPVGPMGPAGPAGPKGDNGAVGPVGPRGLTGERGPIGPQGPQGIPGKNGEVGPMGPPGKEGAMGKPGPAGPAGPRGVGVDNISSIETRENRLIIKYKDNVVPPMELALTNVGYIAGIDFDKGSNTLLVKYGNGVVQQIQIPIQQVAASGNGGAPGPAGPPGPQGAAGPQGPIGAPGPKGDQGLKGDVGPAGPPGPPGPAGNGSSLALNATPLRVAANDGDYTLVGTSKTDGATNPRIVISGHTRTYNAGGIENIATNRGNHMWFTQGGAKRTMLQDADGNTIIDGTLAVVKGNKDKWNWVNVQRNPDDALFFGGDEVNRGIWSHGARPFSVYTGGANRMQVNPDGRTVQNAGSGDWNYVMIGPNGRNVHAVHGGGYGMHINTVDEDPNKYGLQVFNGKFATHQINNDGRHFLNHSSPDWGFRMHGPNGTNIHAVHGQGHGLHINTANQEPEKWALDMVNGKMGLHHVKNDGRQYLNHSNAKDWGFRMTGPGGKNIHAVHGDGYGLHVNTVDQHPEKYGLEIHNGKHHTLHVKNDGRHFLQHGNVNDWGFRMVGPDGRNVHAVHGAGYGLHINTVNEEGGKYGLEVHNGKVPNLRVMNNGSTILGTGPNWHPGADVNANGTILHKDGQIRSRNTTEGEWVHKFYGKEHINAHLLHNAGYGMHINTRNSDHNKFSLELYNDKGPTLQVRNDGAIINFRQDGRQTWLSHPDGKNYIRGETVIDNVTRANGGLCIGGTCINENHLKMLTDGFRLQTLGNGWESGKFMHTHQGGNMATAADQYRTHYKPVRDW